MTINLSLLNRIINQQTQQLDTLYSKIDNIENVVYQMIENSGNTDSGNTGDKLASNINYVLTITPTNGNFKTLDDIKAACEKYENLGIEGYGQTYTFNQLSIENTDSSTFRGSAFYGLCKNDAKVIITFQCGYDPQSCICVINNDNTSQLYNLLEPFNTARSTYHNTYQLPKYTISNNTLTADGGNSNYCVCRSNSFTSVIFCEIGGIIGMIPYIDNNYDFGIVPTIKIAILKDEDTIETSNSNAISFCAIGNTTDIINISNNFDTQNGISVEISNATVSVHDYGLNIDITFPDLANYQVEGYVFIIYGPMFGGSITLPSSHQCIIPIMSESVIPKSQLQPLLEDWYSFVNLTNDSNNIIYSVTYNSTESIQTSYTNNKIRILYADDDYSSPNRLIAVTMRYTKIE